jgi:hypothetical protein
MQGAPRRDFGFTGTRLGTFLLREKEKPPAPLTNDGAEDAEFQHWRLEAPVEQRLKILYYPVWQARYLFRGRPYEIAVDGVTGKVLRGRGPAEMRPAVELALAGLALSALCFGRPGRQLFMSGLATGGQGGWVFGALGASLALLVGGTVAALLAWLA